ncbi:Reverse transcriptase-like [Sesbania bispinosa]|nr:Reverse transcriptase-like [Sesbania bispinosa]
MEEALENTRSTKNSPLHLETYAQLPSGPDELITLFFSLCYSFWVARNKLIFEQQEVNLQLLYNKATDAALSIGSGPAQVSVIQHGSAPQDARWTPPPPAPTRSMLMQQNPGLAEAMGIRCAINFAMETDFETVIIESDCKAVTDLFSGNYVRRGGNMCAHHLAKFTCSHPNSYWIEDAPDCIVPFMAMDYCPRPN